MKELIKQALAESAEIKSELAKEVNLIIKIAEAFMATYQQGGKVILFGNGGSAADAQHIAAELVGRFKRERSALPAIALTTNTSILTALANDYSFDDIFARQVEALVKKGDLCLGISTSGNSPNVLAGIREAKKLGAKTIGFTGQSGGKLAGLTDLCLKVPSNDTPRIQEAHITIGHIICDLVERELFDRKQ
ncbi:MAG: D-sedoheptulose 7-phosphate isomerase [bacterium]